MKPKDCQSILTNARQPKFTSLLAACLIIAGCAGPVLREPPEARRPGARPTTPGQPATPDQGVVSGLAVERGVLISKTGCTLSFERHLPAQVHTSDLVILGHGFLRRKEHLRGLALAIAATGVTTLSLDFCRDRPWETNHFRKALDMMRLADTQGARGVVYAGFSAGALAALIAGRNDPRTIGVVALDLVDAQGLGVMMARGLDRPLIGLVGEPSSCNAYNNGLAVFAASTRSRVQRFDGADHCDFESPTDWRCRLVCQEASASRQASTRRDIVRATTAAVRSLTMANDGH